MKTKVFLLAFLALILSINFTAFAQENGLRLSLTKTNNSIYSISDNGKHVLNFEISGIESQKEADNLLKFIRSYRGVEEFNLIKIVGTSDKYTGSGVFYEYAEMPYFKNLFKVMKVTEVTQNNEKTTIDNL